VLLDRLGSGVVTAADLLAAAHTAVHWQAGICPKPRVDVSDVLLQLVLQLQQQEQEQEQQQRAGKHRHTFVSLVSAVFPTAELRALPPSVCMPGTLELLV
jgi:hypothetical protein